jgi:vacuolar-type H+-ATPase subunit H
VADLDLRETARARKEADQIIKNARTQAEKMAGEASKRFPEAVDAVLGRLG